MFSEKENDQRGSRLASAQLMFIRLVAPLAAAMSLENEFEMPELASDDAEGFFCGLCGECVDDRVAHARTHGVLTIGKMLPTATDYRLAATTLAVSERLPPCHTCGAAFGSERARTAHVSEGTCAPARPYACPMPGCTKAFQTSSGLRTHASLAHGPPAAKLQRKCVFIDLVAEDERRKKEIIVIDLTDEEDGDNK